MTQVSCDPRLRDLLKDGVLRCPEDGELLGHDSQQALCGRCGSFFPIHAGVLIDLKPRKCVALAGEVSPLYQESYRELSAESFVHRPDAMSWGAPERCSQGWVAARQAESARVVGELAAASGADRSLACDISAGAGYAVFELARRFDTVLYCDLSVDGLNYGMQVVKRRQLTNVLFVRLDLLSLPFRGRIPALVCLDTLIYGRMQAKTALTAISLALAPRGAAFVDFHNWWHNPLRRLGLMPDNFKGNWSCGRGEAQQLATSCGLLSRYTPWRDEFVDRPLARNTIGRLIPPTRHGLLLTRAERGTDGEDPHCP